MPMPKISCKIHHKKWMITYTDTIFRQYEKFAVAQCMALTVTIVTITAISCTILTAAIAGPSYSEHLLLSLRGPMTYNNPELVEYAKNEVLEPPSTSPYNLELNSNAGLMGILPSERFYKNVTDSLFAGMERGVFIEAGALDGETMSVTLPLELNQKWSGLLVEASSKMYSVLKSKHRKTWTANTCLSPKPHPSQELLNVESQFKSVISYSTSIAKSRAMASLRMYKKMSLVDAWFETVQCIPLGSLLLAADIKHVDLFVLDVEGAEMDILDNLDFEAVNIDVLFLEWKEPREHEAIVTKMNKRGYHLIRYQGEDMVFAKVGTKYDRNQITIRLDFENNKFIFTKRLN